jgi:hypothetical protein
MGKMRLNKTLLVTITSTLAALLVACGGDDIPQPGPTPPPVEKPGNVRAFTVTSMSDIKNNISRWTEIKNSRDTADISFPDNTELVAGAAELPVLAQLKDFIQLPNFRVHVGNVALTAGAGDIQLTDAQCELLNWLWSNGIKVASGSAGNRYMISVGQRSLVSPEMLFQLGFIGADKLQIATPKDLKAVADQIKVMTGANQPVEVTWGAPSKVFNFNARNAAVAGDILNNPLSRSSVAANASFQFTVDTIVPAYILNRFYNFPGHIELDQRSNSEFLSGKWLMGANDSTVNITKFNSVPQDNYVFSGKETPVFGFWKNSIAPQNVKAPEGFADFEQTWQLGGSNSLLKLAEMFNMVNNYNDTPFDFKYLYMTSDPDKTFKIEIAFNPAYATLYDGIDAITPFLNVRVGDIMYHGNRGVPSLPRLYYGYGCKFDDKSASWPYVETMGKVKLMFDGTVAYLADGAGEFIGLEINTLLSFFMGNKVSQSSVAWYLQPLSPKTDKFDGNLNVYPFESIIKGAKPVTTKST